MKISPTILNSSSALGSGSVSQCALGIREGAGEGWDTQDREPQESSQGDQETPKGEVEFSRQSGHLDDLKL